MQVNVTAIASIVGIAAVLAAAADRIAFYRLAPVETKIDLVEGRLTSLESRVRDGFAEANRRFGEATETLKDLAAQCKQLRSDLAQRAVLPGSAFDDSLQEPIAPPARESKH